MKLYKIIVNKGTMQFGILLLFDDYLKEKKRVHQFNNCSNDNIPIY